MDAFFKFLEGNPWLNLVFLILALLSLIVSIVFYYRGKKERRPVYNVKSFNLVNEKLSEISFLKIIYGKTEIKTLTLTKFALWNEGRETINNVDIAPSDPLRLIIKDEYQILHAEITFYKKQANNFSITIEPNNKSLLINFDYFHTQEGLVISLYHTGKASADIRLTGTIKGVDSIPKGVVENSEFARPMLRNTFGKILIPLRDGKTNILYYIALYALSPIVVPFTMVLLLIEGFLQLYKRPPKEYKLEDGDL